MKGGVEPNTIVDYFNFLGYTAKLSDPFDETAKQADAAIVWYTWYNVNSVSMGGHYVMTKWNEADQKFDMYNVFSNSTGVTRETSLSNISTYTPWFIITIDKPVEKIRLM